MTERPILFSGPMVRAILEGRKTQTRRVMKNSHVITCDDRTGVTDTPCPFGVSGDRLWVRETLIRSESAYGPKVSYAADGLYCLTGPGSINTKNRREAAPWLWEKKPRPSIHMPRWACRLFLEVVSVRVERLLDISEADAIAEGIEKVDGRWRHYTNPAYAFSPTPIESYFSLWESINGAGTVSADPWVWVVEFEVVKAPGVATCCG